MAQLSEIKKTLTTEYDIQLTIDEVIEPEDTPRDKKKRANLGKITGHLRTPEKDYYLPILQALKEKGGSAPMSTVLEIVGNLMRNQFKKLDHERLKSKPHPVRWQNTAQWARNTMVHELSYLKKDSPYGIWEITTKGIEFLKTNETI